MGCDGKGQGLLLFPAADEGCPAAPSPGPARLLASQGSHAPGWQVPSSPAWQPLAPRWPVWRPEDKGSGDPVRGVLSRFIDLKTLGRSEGFDAPSVNLQPWAECRHGTLGRGRPDASVAAAKGRDAPCGPPLWRSSKLIHDAPVGWGGTRAPPPWVIRKQACPPTHPVCVFNTDNRFWRGRLASWRGFLAKNTAEALSPETRPRWRALSCGGVGGGEDVPCPAGRRDGLPEGPRLVRMALLRPWPRCPRSGWGGPPPAAACAPRPSNQGLSHLVRGPAGWAEGLPLLKAEKEPPPPPRRGALLQTQINAQIPSHVLCTCSVPGLHQSLRQDYPVQCPELPLGQILQPPETVLLNRADSGAST